MLGMRSFNRTLLRGAARGGIERPRGSGQRRVEQDDRNEAEHRRQGTKTILRLLGHANPKLSL